MKLPQSDWMDTAEARAVMGAVRDGRTQLDEISGEETMRIMGILDEARKQVGVVYPEEE